MHGEHAVQNGVGPAVILHAATESRRYQQVVGDLGIVLAERVFTPVDGQLQIVAGVRELSGRGANVGEALQNIVADGVVGRGVLGKLPGLFKRLASGFVVSAQVAGVAGLDEGLHGGRGIILSSRRAAEETRQQHQAGIGGATNRSTHANLVVLIH